jgi:hypothetical protein
MHVEFHNILASEARASAEGKDKGFIQQLTTPPEPSQPCGAVRWQ